jgi:NADPH:quinone reductase-like Zn-dependent oxidoreductase
MRCYQFTDAVSLASLRLVERPDPEPGPRDIIIRMRAAALNFRDIAMIRGDYHIGVSPPLVPLSDGAGEVIRIGDAVTRFQVGELACPTYLPDWHDGPLRADRVRRRLGGPTDGVLTEYMCIHEDEAVRAPRHLDCTEAATLPVAAVTAWRIALSPRIDASWRDVTCSGRRGRFDHGPSTRKGRRRAHDCGVAWRSTRRRA